MQTLHLPHSHRHGRIPSSACATCRAAGVRCASRGREGAKRRRPRCNITHPYGHWIKGVVRARARGGAQAAVAEGNDSYGSWHAHGSAQKGSLVTCKGQKVWEEGMTLPVVKGW